MFLTVLEWFTEALMFLTALGDTSLLLLPNFIWPCEAIN